MIEQYMKRIARHTAVYWGSPKMNKDGVTEFDLPVEIKCFWKGGSEMLVLRTGREINSMATVYVLEDLAEGGMLWLGTLEDLSNLEESDPREISNAYEIQPTWKTPSLAMTNDYVRKVMLG